MIADHLVALARRPIRLEPDPALQRPADVPVLRGDASRLASATGWQPTFELTQTLGDMLDDWRRRVAATPTGQSSLFD